MRVSKKVVRKHVSHFVRQIKAKCPAARIEECYVPYESENARINVYPPEDWTEDQCQELAEVGADLSFNLYMAEEVSIWVLVIRPQALHLREHREREARRSAAQTVREALQPYPGARFRMVTGPLRVS